MKGVLRTPGWQRRIICGSGVIGLAAAIVLSALGVVAFDPPRIYEFAIAAAVGAVFATVAWRAVAPRKSEKITAEVIAAYVRSQRTIEQLDRSYRERLHGARSAVAGIRGAVELLNRPVVGRQTETRRLGLILAAEFDRLQELLDVTSPEPLGDFDLAEALEPVLAARSLDPGRIDGTLQHVTVRGRRHATATVLDNLLRNAQVHAPGAGVDVRVSVEGEFATVVVHDDGPGIPPGECERVLLPGVRGSTATAPGSGLGLHIAASAMAQQGGTLRMARAGHGGTSIAFSLPLATTSDERLSLVRPLAG